MFQNNNWEFMKDVAELISLKSFWFRCIFLIFLFDVSVVKLFEGHYAVKISCDFPYFCLLCCCKQEQIKSKLLTQTKSSAIRLYFESLELFLLAPEFLIKFLFIHCWFSLSFKFSSPKASSWNASCCVYFQITRFDWTIDYGLFQI